MDDRRISRLTDRRRSDFLEEVGLFTLLRTLLLPLLIWSSVVGLALFFEFRQLDEDAVEIIATQGSEVFRLMESTRLWNAEHGGVFVIQNGGTPPNPYLNDPERSTATVTGKKLTLMNPAYMTRQVAEIIERQTGIHIHLTSLKLLNPGNKGDAWENRALQEFERDGLKEKFEIDKSGAAAVARYMAPLYIKQPCLACHAHQGYKLGDVRGGISVYWSAEPILETMQTVRERAVIAYGAVWLLISALLVSGVGYRLKIENALRNSEGRFRQLADYDTLTGLPNRRLLLDRLWQSMSTEKRSGHYGAVMFIDLDNFKPLNDQYGHKVGDMLLVEVAQRISGCLREVDTVARFGGDEFVVVLSDLDADRNASVVAAETVAEKIRAVVAEPYKLTLTPEGKTAGAAIEHRCTSSIGVALFHGHDARTEDVLRWADEAMYQAKSDGRNVIRFFNPPDMKSVRN